MRAAQGLRVVDEPELDPLASARAAVERAETALTAATKELGAACEIEARAVSAFDEDASKEEGAVRARVSRERLERRHAARVSELEVATARLREQQRARDRDEMDDAIRFVATMPERAAPEIRELVEHARAVSDLADRVADHVVETEAAFARATALAESLGMPSVVQRQIARPTLDAVAQLVRVAIALDAKATGRDLLSGRFTTAELEPRWDHPSRPAFDVAVATINRLQEKKT